MIRDKNRNAIDNLKCYYNANNSQKYFDFPDEYFIYHSLKHHHYDNNNLENSIRTIDLCKEFLKILKQEKIDYYFQYLPAFLTFYYDDSDNLKDEPILINSYLFDELDFERSIRKILYEYKDELKNGIAIHGLEYNNKRIRFTTYYRKLMTYKNYNEILKHYYELVLQEK